MKCENCGKNEVTFIYQSNVNGHVEEKHLCSDCAEKLGYTQRIAQHSRSMMQNFFGDGFFGNSLLGNGLFGDSFFGNAFAPMPSLLGRMSRMLEDPFDDFFSEMPALTASPAQQPAQTEERKDDLVGQEEQSRFSRMRQMNALRMELKKAVHQENFERAAELRDQIHALEAAGCEIIRVAIPDQAAAEAVDKIREQISIPLIADIHFNYKYALMCAERGIDAIRINPGNIGGEEKVKAVADICRQKSIPIRIGVNGGSLEKELRAKYGGVTAEALVESAMGHVALLNKFDFDDICISVKCSDVPLTMAAYRLLSAQTDYPLHLGVTEAGTPSMGMVKSAMGIGGLLCLGIGDTIRVTLTADPVEEVYAAKRILRACGLRRSGVNLVSCPTCGRTAYDMIPLAEELERRLEDCDKPITGHGLRCKRPRRGERGGHRRRGRQGRGPYFPSWRGIVQGRAGKAAGRPA